MVACEENGTVQLQVVANKKVHQSIVFVLGYHDTVLCGGIQLPIELNGYSVLHSPVLYTFKVMIKVCSLKKLCSRLTSF